VRFKGNIKIQPSLLSSDFSDLKNEIKKCEEVEADILHLDIMDGHFVPNITFGPPVVKAIRKRTELPLDCHLMIENPDNYIPDFAKAGADMISVHVEAVPHLHRSLALIRSFDKKAGIALNPITPLEYAYEAAPYCDFILLMSVNPGFGGQSFIESFLQRSNKLRQFLDDNGLHKVEIQVDGGIKADNIELVVDAGASMIVSGSGLFKGDLKENIKKMRENIQRNNYV
jgi:ribulose-phosphate 3-epimerase